MLCVGAMLLSSALTGQRSWKYGPDGQTPNCCKRYGPFMIQQLAACLIIADPLRHVLFDVGLWAGCSNNPTYNRVNSTDPFPAQCHDSSYQYACNVPCCVPTWLPDADDTYAWFPPQSQFGELATLRPNNTVYLPSGFDASAQPWSVFKAPAVLWETGGEGVRGEATAAECPFGVNGATGYCFLVNESLPYADRIAQLPLRDASKPYDPDTNPHECNCNQCNPHETMPNLAPLGVLFTIFFTYTGFILLAGAVAWNANIMDKLKGFRQKWRALRGTRAVVSA